MKADLKDYFRRKRRAAAKFPGRKIFFTPLLIIAVTAFSTPGTAQQIQTQRKTDRQNEDQQKILADIRVAKIFIDNEEWEPARAKLSAVVKDYPQNRYLDIAYYWLAYALFQQGKFSEAGRVIGNLQREFPNSAWIDESKLLTVEINSKNGQQTALKNEELFNSDDETIAFAVQNLIKTDRAKAVVAIDRILGPGSAATDTLKESVLILLFDDKTDWATGKFIQALKIEKGEKILIRALIGLGKRDEKMTLPVLRDFLERNDNEDLIDAALYAVSGRRSEAALAILLFFAQNGRRADLQQKSIIWIGNWKSEKAIDELKKLYGFYTADELKRQVQISLSEIGSPEAYQALIELIEGEKNEDLIEHGLELLGKKNDPAILRYLEKKAKTKN